MKATRTILSCILALCLFASVIPAAFADTLEDYEPKLDMDAALRKARDFIESVQGKTDEEIAAEKGVSLWTVTKPYGTSAPADPQLYVAKDESWDDVVASLIKKYVADDGDFGSYRNIAMAYYNTVTGEEHYYNGDKYLVSASMFKVPLNMIMADKIHNGEITWDTDIWGQKYGFYQFKTIVESDNERSVTLFQYLGGYESFKQLQIKYFGEGQDPEADLGWNYHIENFYTARQLCNCLKMIYAEPDRFAGIAENMLEAEPYSYFRRYEKRYPIAQKYGFVEQNESTGFHSYVNDCAIVYHDTPFILVMFTDNIPQAYDVLAEYCTLMTDYTTLRLEETREAEKKTGEERPAAELTAGEERPAAEQEAEKVQPVVQAVPTEVPEIPAVHEIDKPVVVNSRSNERFFGMTPTDLIIIVAVFAAMLLCLVLIFRRNGAGRMNGFWGVLAIIFAGAAMLCCVVGNRLGTLYARVSANPQETVVRFYDSILSGDYETAYSCLVDYSSLGLENMPSGTESRMMYEALKNSYSYSLRGASQEDKLNATQRVAFRYLNLPAVKNEAAGKVDELVAGFVEARPRNQLYDENGDYLPSLTDEIYLTALSNAVDDAEQFYSSMEYDVKLVYSDGKWLMTTCPEMLNAFLGGIS